MNMLAGLSVLRVPLPRLLPRLFRRLFPRFSAAGPVRRPASCITRPHFDGELPSTEKTADDSSAELHACACGWFDSSHALRHGLLVREHASDDCLGTELPLAQWLELHLQGWHGQAAGAA